MEHMTRRVHLAGYGSHFGEKQLGPSGTKYTDQLEGLSTEDTRKSQKVRVTHRSKGNNPNSHLKT